MRISVRIIKESFDFELGEVIMSSILRFNNFCATYKGNIKEEDRLICNDKKGKFSDLPVDHVLLKLCFKP